MISYYKCKELIILYIIFTTLLPEAVKMSSSDKKQATITKNNGAKLAKTFKHLEFASEVNEDSDFSNIQPSAFLPPNQLTEFLTIPSAVPSSTPAICHPTSHPRFETFFPYRSSFHNPTADKRKEKRTILSTALQLPNINKETLTMVNILDQEYYGSNEVDDGTWTKVHFQIDLPISFKSQVLKMFKKGKFF